MRPFGAWFGRLAMAGASLAWAGCGGGDVPDPDGDSSAAREPQAQVVNRGPQAPAEEAAKPEAPAAEAPANADPAPVAAAPARPEAPAESPAPAVKGEASAPSSPLVEAAAATAATGSPSGPGPAAPTGEVPQPGGPTPPPTIPTAGAMPARTGAAGTMPGMAGAMPGAAGAMPGMAGAVPGTAGAMPGMAGAAPGTAGAMPGMAGAMPGMAGAMNSPAGITTAGSEDGRGAMSRMPGAPGFGMPGAGQGGPNDSGSDGPASFRFPNSAVNAFLAALKAKDKDRLATATAKRAPTEAAEKHRKIFAAIVEQSISDDELEEMSQAMGGYQIMGVLDAKSTGRIGVVVAKQSGRDMLRRTIMTRKEKDGWKVLDIEDMYDFKPGLPPIFMRGRSGRRR